MEKTAKIYRITNDVNDRFYIGSTSQRLLSDRMWKHSSSSMDPKVSNFMCRLYQEMRRLGQFHFDIELLEEFHYTDRKEIVMKEQGWMDYYIYVWDHALNQRRAMR